MRVLAGLCLVATTWSASAGAGSEAPPRIHRLVRTYDWASGYPWSYVAGVEQDARGFLWVTTTAGFYRFDGVRAVRVGEPMLFATGGTQAGRVLVYGDRGTFEVTAEGLVPLDGGVADPEVTNVVMAVAADGTPWRVRAGALERLDEGRGWTAIPIETNEGDPLRRVHPGREGRMYVSSLSEVWVVAPDGSARSLASIERAVVVLERVDGTVVVGTNQAPSPVTTRLYEIDGERSRAVFEEHRSRLLSIVERGDTIWVSMDSGVQALGPDYAPRDRVERPAIQTGGHLIVDRERSLWMASSSGLVQIPEPDVHGIAPPHGMVTRDLARTGEGVWATFWGVLAFFSEEAGALRMTEAGEHYAMMCEDRAGRVWTIGRGGILRLDPDGATRLFDESRPFDPHGCGDGSGQRVWIASWGRDVWTVAPGEERPHRVPIDLALDEEGLSFAAEAADGTLWLATGSRMCGAPAADLLARRPVSWRCETMPGGYDVIDLQPVPSGDMWALARDPALIRRRAGGRWEPVPGAARLGTNFVTSMTPSPSGGLWVTGQGLLARIAERPDLPEGMQILERPTVWNGMITINLADVHEDQDGTLWLGTDLGIEKIPAAIRNRRPDPPAVELVDGSVNGVALEAQRPVRLPARDNRLVVHFAALTYRDPAAVRYRMRLDEDEEWSAPSAAGQFTFVDLRPGRYVLEVAATLDGEHWSSPPARLEFAVRLPWYGDPWWIAGMTLGSVAALHMGYRLRLRRRLVRERQRTRIAMDLHDAIGSGLGSIRILAGLAERTTTPDGTRAQI